MSCVNKAELRKLILKTNPEIKTISGEALQWLDSVAEEAAKNLAASGRRTPGGRLMAPKLLPMDYARLEAKVFAAPTLQVIDSPASMPGEPKTIRAEEWSDYNDWQTERRGGKTQLSFEKWQAAKKEET